MHRVHMWTKYHVVTLASKCYIIQHDLSEFHFRVPLQSSAWEFCIYLYWILTRRALLEELSDHCRSKKTSDAAGMNERGLNMRQRCCNKRAKGWDSWRRGIMPGALLKLPVRDKPHCTGRSPMSLSSETPEEREARLQRIRDTLAAETLKVTEGRLQQMSNHQHERLPFETPTRGERNKITLLQCEV